ncbi:MAG: hypothetical protein GF355_06225, partial [Candidatus Eisenbacteria bacterium]|nr:hypothetical protein [Candidatus Eisenbacteria bacterium]
GGEPIWSAEERRRYQRGSAPITGREDGRDWSEIASAWEASQEKLRAALGGLKPEQLLAPLPEDRNPFKVGSLAEMIGALAFHESYHVGQLGVLRRAAGLAGAIR